MITFGISYWFAFLIAAILAATGVMLLLYFRNSDNKAMTKSQVWLLMSLRFLSFFLIAFLLLSPLIKNLKKIVARPLVVMAWDNSGSLVSAGDSAAVAKRIDEMKEYISDALDNEFQVVNYTFGEDTEADGELDFSEKKSDYNRLINTVTANHFNENIGALILTGDGIYNEGKNPVNTGDRLNYPIYTIGLGDTTAIMDARIENVVVNRTAFSGNRFPAEVEVGFLKLKNIPHKISIEQEGKEIAGIVVTPPNNNYFFTEEFILDAGKAGIKHFTAKVEIAEDERNTRNNSSGFVVNVLENRQRILILSSAPHPDIGAIRNTLEEQPNYEVSVFSEEPYPADFSEYNLLILNQLPATGKSAAEIIKKATANRVPVLFIVGRSTFIPQLNTLAQGVNIKPLAGSPEEAQPYLNRSYATFTLSEEVADLVPKFPPLAAPFADYDLEPDFPVLFYQRIKNLETTKPLIATGNINGRKTGFIFGEGLWRWRLYNYYYNQSHSQFNELVTKLIQFLALRENEDNFMIDYKPIYDETEHVTMTAELYNEAFERITSEEIVITIRSNSGEEFDFIFDVRNEVYHLDAGMLPDGDYSFTAEVDLGEQTYSEEGNFTIIPVNVENMAITANHRMLFQMAANSGGKFYHPDAVNQLVEDLKESSSLQPVSYFQEAVNEILNLRWVFFILLLLLSVEWFLRKFWGIY